MIPYLEITIPAAPSTKLPCRRPLNPPRSAGRRGGFGDRFFTQRLNCAAFILFFDERYGIRVSDELGPEPPYVPEALASYSRANKDDRRLHLLGLGACFGGPIESFVWRKDDVLIPTRPNYLLGAKNLLARLMKDEDLFVRMAAKWLTERLSVEKDGRL